MTYLSANRLNDFEFHDAVIKLICCTDGQLTVSAEELNIHKSTEQNAHPTDMEIEQAQLTFDCFSLTSFDSGSTWTRDANGAWFMSEEGYVLTGEKAMQKFLDELKDGITVFSFEPFDDASYCIDGASRNEPWFSIRFTFSSVSIEWNEYRKIAWYEENHWKKN